MTTIAYRDFSDLHALFDQSPMDVRYTRMFLYPELADIVRVLGEPIAAPPRPYERELVQRVRRLLDETRQPGAEVPLLPCSGCRLIGKRWTALDDGKGYLTYSVDTDSLDELYESDSNSASSVFFTEIQRLESRYDRLKLRRASPFEVPDFVVRAEPMDGRGRTLGATIRYRSADDDIDVGGNSFVSVEIIFDSAEYWNAPFFRVVAIHEFLHCLGLDHAPDTFDDIMRARYAGFRTDYGPWTLEQLHDRFIGRPLLPA